MNTTPRNLRVVHKRRADRAITEHKVKRFGWNAAVLNQRDREVANQRRLLGRFGDNRISGSKCCRDLPDEDREWEIPRRNRDEGSARAIEQLIILARRTRQGDRLPEYALCFPGVVAEEIDGLTKFGQCVIQCFAGFGLQKREDAPGFCLEAGGSFEQKRRARQGACPPPSFARF